ncbi:hypothetical protein ACT80S_13405 [Ramlibacter sp. MAHUQ-53]|uniref:hypothetical protein n=1 Tax=unclassified Ramlibacter TaxID=2617605 RepID=UPI0036401C0E
MNRWTRPTAILLSALLAAAGAFAQSLAREIPADARPARLVVTLAPQVLVNGQPAQLSPGARIRDTRNLLVLSASLTGQDLPVALRRDTLGLVHEVWLLTEAEYARLPRR